MIYLIIFLISFLRVASRAFQQQNVIGHKWTWIIPTSYTMSVMDYIIIGVGAVAFIEEDWLKLMYLSFFGGTGSWVGCWFAIWFYEHLNTNSKGTNNVE